MDTPLPTVTYAAEIAATVDDLERGLVVFPLSKAVNRVDDWRRMLLATEKESLVPVADALGELRDSMVGEGVSGAIIGPILVRLGEMTEAVAHEAADEAQGGLRRLGSVLRHAGGAFGGPAADAGATARADA